MMRHEFIERTGYTPEIRRAENGFDIEYDEYEYIEMSYYDSDKLKDEFCDEWLKEFKAGFWKKELDWRIAGKEAVKSLRAKHDKILELQKEIQILKADNDMLKGKLKREQENSTKLGNKLMEIQQILKK